MACHLCRCLSLNFDVWNSVADFSGDPPSIYALCMSHTHWHHRVSADALVLATVLLRRALRASLKRVLAAHEVPGSLIEFVAFVNGQSKTPVAVFSGSLMVQVALGVVWKTSDVDIFCTAGGAREVFAHLTEFPECDCDTDCETSDEEYDAMMAPSGVEGPGEDLACAAAPSVLPRARCNLLARVREVALLSDTSCKDYDICEAIATCSDARYMLGFFDLVICRTFFDGLALRVVDPHMTFQWRSRVGVQWTPDRSVVVRSCTATPAREVRRLLKYNSRGVSIDGFRMFLDASWCGRSCCGYGWCRH